MTIVEYLHSLFGGEETGTPKDAQPGFLVRSFSNIKKVTKPWGFELWLSDATETPYALKIIYIKKGTKTSLQVHRKKAEHNTIFFGKARFYYENADKELKTVDMGPGHVITILPNTVHRLEALTDLVLFEGSTGELDDVIRLADDYQRPDGKILSEHDGA
ncbi:MAG: cupin domain-containing protein [Candidatus Liptonbacteria bacterium]|nr:cupin domain-containing protein [Candidatus Liptonbacteria bacterium]